MKQTILVVMGAGLLSSCTDHANHTNQPQQVNDTVMHHQHRDTMETNPVTASMDKMMKQMHTAKPTGNNDIDFAVMMVEHHKGAVDMSKVELEKGTNDSLRKFAQQVIDDQNREITFMENFIANHSKEKSSTTLEFQQALQQSMMVMMSDHVTVYNHIDKDFAAQMIPHHQSAIEMAKAYLQFGKDAALRKLCENIVKAQSNEIRWLEDWLKSQK